MIPHKVHGTHIFYNNKYKRAAFNKSAKNFKIMKKEQKNMTPEVVKSKECELISIVEFNGTHVLCVGRNLISKESFKSVTDAEKYIASKPYELIVNLCITLYYETQKEQPKEEVSKVAKEE